MRIELAFLSSHRERQAQLVSVGLSIKGKAMDVARSSPLGPHCHADGMNLHLLLRITRGTRSLWCSELGLHQLISPPTLYLLHSIPSMWYPREHSYWIWRKNAWQASSNPRWGVLRMELNLFSSGSILHMTRQLTCSYIFSGKYVVLKYLVKWFVNHS